jgi:hypothetical protein
MNAELRVARIERRVSLDTISDCDWLLTELDGDRVVESMRYEDGDIATYGLRKVRGWVAEDGDRYRSFGESWWFLDMQAVAIVEVVVSDKVIGQFGYCSMLIGGIESDASRDYLDEMSGILVREVTETLADLGLTIPDGIDTPYVQGDPWLAEALA